MVKPFIKWAGGKTQILNEIEENLPLNLEEMSTYVEPFIGGGAVLFKLLEKYDFDKIYKGEISKSGTAILPSKRTKRMPEKANFNYKIYRICAGAIPDVKINLKIKNILK